MDYGDKLPLRPWHNFTPPLWRIVTPPLTREAADYVGLSPKTLGRWRVTGEGPRYIKRRTRVFCEVVDLDAWMEEGKRRFTAEEVEE